MTPEEARKLAEEHWAWLEGILEAGNVSITELHTRLYVAAFIHGIKHGQEAR